MNAPWYHPAGIDWEDGLNPLAIPAFREQRNPYVYRCLQHPTLVELRHEPGYRLALYVAPNAAFATLGAASTYDSSYQLPAGAWIIGVSAQSPQPEGFLMQLTAPTGVNMFSRPTNVNSFKGAKPYYFARPQGSPTPGALKLHMQNLSTSTNAAQVAVWVIQPL